MLRYGLFLILFTQAALANHKPAFDLRLMEVIRLKHSHSRVSTQEDAVKKVDELIEKTLASLPRHISSELRPTYGAYANNLLKDGQTPITRKILGLYHGEHTHFGHATGFPYGAELYTHFEVYVNKSFATTPLLMRYTLVHEVFGHLTHYVSLSRKEGMRNFSKKFFNDRGAMGSEFFMFTHAATSFIEWQFFRMFPLKLILAEVNGTDWTPEKKRNWEKRLRLFYDLSAKELVKTRAQAEACKQGPGSFGCPGDAELEAYYKHFYQLGFKEFAPGIR